MLLAVGLTVYAMAMAVMTRVIAGHFAWKWTKRKHIHDMREYPNLYRENNPYGERSIDLSEPNGDMWFSALSVGALVALLWPFTLTAYVVSRRWQVGDEAQATLRAREKAVQEREREVDRLLAEDRQPRGRG